jgi:hypothetical protein
MPLTTKLMLMTLIPLALLVYNALEIYKEKSDKISILNNYLERIRQSADVSSLAY